jgi:flagellar motor switch/type III secretory pathway protein FliN
MHPRPYLLLGDGDRRFIAQRVETALAAWRGEWLAGGAPDRAPSAASELRAERWLAAQAGEKPLLLLGCRGDWRAQLGTLTVMEAPQPGIQGDRALAAKVCETMLEALAAQVLNSLSATAAPQMSWGGEGAPQSWLAPGAGAALYDLSPALPLVLALAPELVAASLPKAHTSRTGREPLAALARALEPCRVGLEAVVGDAELDLGQLAHLAAGDVIVLERRLDEPLALRLEAGESVGAAHLGTLAGRKAVQLVACARDPNLSRNTNE